MSGVRVFCWKDEECWVTDWSMNAPIGHPQFTDFMFKMTGCDRIQLVDHKALEVDLR